MQEHNFPQNQGLYNSQFEHDSCGVGFVCDIKGSRSHKIVEQALEVLRRLAHRGAVGADPKTGDGAGILLQIPHEFFLKAAVASKISLPSLGGYGTGLVFLPRDIEERIWCKEAFYRIIQKEGQTLLGWRNISVNDSVIGNTAKETMPFIAQVFIKKDDKLKDEIDPLIFERKLYVIRKQMENTVRASGLKQKSFFYITSLSSRTFIYKGLLMPYQLEEFFPELKDKDVKSSLCLVHSRYSTNTFPAWDLAQPFRYLAHNGEINTLRGNINWMQAREKLLESELLGSDIEKIKPAIVPGGSDSAAIDNVFELLILTGRSLPGAMMMLIPQAWEGNIHIDDDLKSFYQYHACFMEPWDGPSAIAFTDGLRVGAVLDRNGLRPARYIVTKQGLVVMASEAGVLDITPKDISFSGRLKPGKILFIDTHQGCIVSDEEIKETFSKVKPYKVWIKDNLVDLKDISYMEKEADSLWGVLSKDNFFKLIKSFGYTREDLKAIITPMAETGEEPIGSMGNDTPHAVLSVKPQLLYNYFKQLFAQVTNPAIDPIREELVMSLTSYVGTERNILAETPQHCHKLKIDCPILTNEELEKIRGISTNRFKTKVISILFDSREEDNFLSTIDRICKEAVRAIEEGYTFIILSDRETNRNFAAIPALLAMGAVHHHLVRMSLRTRIGIILESAEPREVHHFALLFGYGADCINPYLIYEIINYLTAEGDLQLEYKSACKKYIKAVNKGILKIISKMGISTLQSYRGAQIFEALGLNNEIIDNYFAGTVSRMGGAGLRIIVRETILRHKEAYDFRSEISLPRPFLVERNSEEQKGRGLPYLSYGGVYQWRKNGEFHLWNPQSISLLQDAVRKNDYTRYKEFADTINDQSKNPVTLRSLLKFKTQKSIPIEEVEPPEEIFKRFATGAMSFGSISGSVHKTIALAMNKLGGRSNTGEGGEDPARFIPLPNGDSMRSAIKQVASGRFGVTANYLVNADELQIKISQGAKPGEGGQLPGHKVSAIIAKTRYTTQGVTLISPPPHHDIYSIEDLAQLIFDLKNVNPNARVSVKLVSEAGVGTIAAGVAKGHADMILISGGDGGTGASPKSSIRHAGLPWELGLSETHQTLVLNNLRSRVRLQTDGQMRTGQDAAVAALLGAEEFGFCTAVLIVLGCVMLRHCHLNNCALGVAVQDEILEKQFKGRPEYIINYFQFVVQELREIMARLGVRELNDLIGKTEFLTLNKDIIPWKAKEINYSRLLYKPKVSPSVGIYCQIKQDHAIRGILDRELIELAKPALEKKQPIKQELKIENTNRTTGAMLSGHVCRIFGEEGLMEDTIHFKFKGVAGQSFGAWLAGGITFELEGLANDYVGKGVSGGKIIIYPFRETQYKSEENIIIGNTTFYGAIKGEAYIRGLAGERFCIRNSGLYAVVEGVGDHGCEYMTGGCVVVLGQVGRNFAAGMSGGTAYIYDQQGGFKDNCNMSMVELGKPDCEDKKTIFSLVNNHYKYTKSEVSKKIIDNFNSASEKFIKIIPIEYKSILEKRKLEGKLDLLEVSDG